MYEFFVYNARIFIKTQSLYFFIFRPHNEKKQREMTIVVHFYVYPQLFKSLQ